MVQILLSLLKKAKVSSILKVVESDYRDLNCADVFYTKGGTYFVARAFYTDAWISSRPIGPELSVDGYLSVDGVESIATIFTFDNSKSWMAFPPLPVELLKNVYKLVERQAISFISPVFGQYVELVTATKFTFTPTPSIIVTLCNSDGLLGTCTVQLDGSVQLLFATSSAICKIIEDISSSTYKSLYKEMLKCLPEVYR